MTKPPSRDDLEVGLATEIEMEGDQNTGRLTSGTIVGILTPDRHRPRGIQVRLQDGRMDRVKKVVSLTIEEPAHSSVEFAAKPIPKTEDKHNKFEFYQYDVRIEDLTLGAAKCRKATEGIKCSVRKWFAVAMYAFGNDSQRGFVHLGIRADGTLASLERDKKVGNFADYDYSFTNHIRDTLETFLWDRVFIIRNIRVQFRRADGKTICTVRALPADRPLYLHAAKGQTFYVRSPAPRAKRLAAPQVQFRYSRLRFPDYG